MAKVTFSTRHQAKIFDQIAKDYDNNRLGYPDSLVDYSCNLGKLKPGDEVLEIGCGSGQLTRSLVNRGFNVTAIDPGKNLLDIAKDNMSDSKNVEFINSKFEDLELNGHKYKAVFSASAFHWIDPAISWKRAAELLDKGGLFSLIQHFGLKDKSTASDLKLQLNVIKKFAPELVAKWPSYYSLDEIMSGIKQRQVNISEAWSWLGGYDIERKYVADLFEVIKAAAMPNVMEHDADELIGLLKTVSTYNSLSHRQRTGIEDEFKKIHKNLNRSFKSSTITLSLNAVKRMI